MFNVIREWLKEQSPITQPKLVELKVEGVITDFGINGEGFQLNLPLLLSSETSSDYSLSYPNLLSTEQSEAQIIDTFFRNYFENLSNPKIIEKEISKFETTPNTIDVLEVLRKPGSSGKMYGEKGEEKEAIQQKLAFDTTAIDRTNCKHGVPRYACALCDEEGTKPKSRGKPTGPKVKTVNVFDLLLPFLQPPFEYMLDQPILFPPGRRPFDYQVEGIRFLIKRETALLGDDMGLGKTIQTIVAIRILFRNRKISKILIVCPLSLLGNWEKEIKKWAPELFLIKVRGAKELREALWKSPSIIYLTTYETLRDDTQRYLISGALFNLVILDEVQRIKNANTAISKSVRNLGSKYRWGLSGTPLENKLEDVVAIFRFLGPQVFKSDKEYSSKQVNRLIKPYFLRRRIKDVRNDLPDKHFSVIWLDLNDIQREVYDDVYAQAVEDISRPGTTRIHIFALINKLKQICNLEPETGDSCKADYLKEQLGEIIEGGYKALVFSQFPQKTLVAIKEQLHNYEPEILHGSLSSKQRERIFEDFQETDSPKILLASIKAAGVGLNLTRANHVFHFDHWWNPAIARQAEARAHRIGQTLPVFVHDIYTNDTVEERIYNILLEKQALFDEVIDDLSSDYTMSLFSDDELYKIFDLEKPITQISEEPVLSQTYTNFLNRIKILTPQEFEQIVAHYFEKLGFVAKVTGGSYDEGVDVIARRASEIGLEHFIIQCKHYPNAVIGPSVIREMIGTKEIHKDATSAFVVTSGSFSDEAIRLAERNNIKLIDGMHFHTLINKHQISF